MNEEGHRAKIFINFAAKFKLKHYAEVHLSGQWQQW